MNFSHVQAVTVLLMATVPAAWASEGSDARRQPVAAVTADTSLPTIEGAFAGRLDASQASSAFQLLVLPEGDFFAVYGDDSRGGFLANGYMHGNRQTTGADSWAGSGRDFRIEPEIGVQLKATHAAHNRVSGTVVASDGVTATFNGAAMPVATFDYKAPAQLASIVGAWSMATPYDQGATLAIAADGALSGSVDGCSFSGSATPFPGRNLFNVAMTFGAEPCALVGQTARGIAMSPLLADGRRQLMVMVRNESSTEGGLLVGARPDQPLPH